MIENNSLQRMTYEANVTRILRLGATHILRLWPA